MIELIAEEQGREVKPDQFADKGYFYRSDQFSLAKIGVPAMYLKPGTDYVDRPPGWGREQQNHYTNVHYHQPSDEYNDSWDFSGLIEDALLGYWTGLAIANSDEMPAWKPGSYTIRDFGGNLTQLAAETAAGEALETETIDANSWRVTTAGASEVVVRYTLKTRPRTGFGSSSLRMMAITSSMFR